MRGLVKCLFFWPSKSPHLITTSSSILMDLKDTVLQFCFYPCNEIPLSVSFDHMTSSSWEILPPGQQPITSSPLRIAPWEGKWLGKGYMVNGGWKWNPGDGIPPEKALRPLELSRRNAALICIMFHAHCLPCSHCCHCNYRVGRGWEKGNKRGRNICNTINN